MNRYFYVKLLTMLLLTPQLWAADAGCGLGSVIIQKNSKLLQLFAVTTNATLLSQPLGITFGTSNCSASGIVMTDKEVQYFVEVNQSELTREMAQGQGEKLITLAALHGCLTDDGQKAFGKMTRSSFNHIVPAANTSATDLTQNLQKEALNNTDVQKLCQAHI